mmetsp:Transcript_26678/g.48994  ORF Transcript_26678/g.48994 Transcript_26678/m.48994 type:complete len:191 (-) Transcript_26678:1451-2023(-)
MKQMKTKGSRDKSESTKETNTYTNTITNTHTKPYDGQGEKVKSSTDVSNTDTSKADRLKLDSGSTSVSRSAAAFCSHGGGACSVSERVLEFGSNLEAQIIGSQAEDLAVEDLQSLLDRMAHRGIIPLDSYLRQTRALARRQYFARASHRAASTAAAAVAAGVAATAALEKAMTQGSRDHIKEERGAGYRR